MHPLLSPTTHADLEVLSRNLSVTGYYENSDESYLKMFLGVTLGLTVLESLHGLTIQNGRHPVLKMPLVERVIRRSKTHSFTAKTGETSLIMSFLVNGKRLGDVALDQAEYSPPVSKEDLYNLAIVKGSKLYFTDLFPHKFSTDLELTAAGVSIGGTVVGSKVEAVKEAIPGVTTADQLEKPKAPNKRELAENSQKYLDWQNQADQLDTTSPDAFDVHAQQLAEFTFIPPGEMNSIWSKFKELAKARGFGYNSDTRKFYLLSYAPHVAYEKQPV